MQRIQYARQQKAYKKLSHILTKALRLHPAKPDLWMYASQTAMDEHADMTEARSYMQRGLRFCKTSKRLWLEYAKLELLYLAKLAARQQVLGIGWSLESKRPSKSSDDIDPDISNPVGLRVEDVHLNKGTMHDVDEDSLPKLAKSSVLSGAIPIAIFDAAMDQFGHDEKLAQDFFHTVQDMGSIPCMRSILMHIVDEMLRSHQSSWRTVLCDVKVSCVGIATTSPEFPKAFGESLRKLQAACTEARQHTELSDAMRTWLETYLNNDSLDAALRQIMLSTLGQLQPAAKSGHAGSNVAD